MTENITKNNKKEVTKKKKRGRPKKNKENAVFKLPIEEQEIICFSILNTLVLDCYKETYYLKEDLEGNKRIEFKNGDDWQTLPNIDFLGKICDFLNFNKDKLFSLLLSRKFSHEDFMFHSKDGYLEDLFNFWLAHELSFTPGQNVPLEAVLEPTQGSCYYAYKFYCSSKNCLYYGPKKFVEKFKEKKFRTIRKTSELYLVDCSFRQNYYESSETKTKIPDSYRPTLGMRF